MKNEQEPIFEYGQKASVSACPSTAYHDDSRMQKLVSEAAHQHNQENVRAWYMDYLTQMTVAGNGILQETFTEALTILLDCEPESAPKWIRFATECVEQKQFVDFAQESDHDQAVNRWLETLLSGLLKTQKQYGANIAKQVCDLALLSNCLYPSEMMQAAAYFQKGGSPKEIGGMIESGAIEGEQPFFPKLSDVAEENPDYSPYANVDWTVIGI